MSQERAEEYGYGQSLMERLCRQLGVQLQNKVIDRLPVLRLTTQYRMHPEICLFPSNYVYNRALKTDMFLKSLQRLNVTLTRAKYSLFILGHLKTLMC
uniref:probable helicase senataxin isoform X2 n=1 Tax=Podarcis muralis TaxID=64176 RepID=UPI00109F80D2|nr:probable helicase senataxin isoform X2 [Podarcis muralis]